MSLHLSLDSNLCIFCVSLQEEDAVQTSGAPHSLLEHLQRAHLLSPPLTPKHTPGRKQSLSPRGPGALAAWRDTLMGAGASLLGPGPRNPCAALLSNTFYLVLLKYIYIFGLV